MKPIIVCILVLSIVFLVQSESLADGSLLLESCIEADKFTRNEISYDKFKAGYCIGIVKGVFDLMMVTRDYLPKKGKLCIPDKEIQDRQKVKIVLKYLENDTEQLHLLEAALTSCAFVKAFPCNNNP